MTNLNDSTSEINLAYGRSAAVGLLLMSLPAAAVTLTAVGDGPELEEVLHATGNAQATVAGRPSLAHAITELQSATLAWLREDRDELIALVPVAGPLMYDWRSLSDMDREQFAAVAAASAVAIVAGDMHLLPRYRDTEHDEECDADVIRRARMPEAMKAALTNLANLKGVAA